MNAGTQAGPEQFAQVVRKAGEGVEGRASDGPAGVSRGTIGCCVVGAADEAIAHTTALRIENVTLLRPTYEVPAYTRIVAV